MRLKLNKARLAMYFIGAVLTTASFGALSRTVPNTFADNEKPTETSDYAAESHYITIFDQKSKLTIKSDAITVREALERANYQISDADAVEPALTERITDDNFKINIYRARPVIIIDGQTKKYLMTPSYDGYTIARSAGITIYDGDEIKLVPNTYFLEAGDASIYQITRNGGRTVTIETPIAYQEETVEDPNLDEGVTEVRQVGEDGMTTSVYQVNFVDNVEVSRELASEATTKEPVNKITVIGTKNAKKAATVKSIPPEWDTCASWARAAGVSEADLYSALTLIYHESGCRYDAKNASSGAYGIPQALPGKKMAEMGADWETNPVTQIKWLAQYVTGRYGGWQQAMDWWWNKHWY
ncbi:G5 domain-containing protein [Candidatus Saccharibacteria bacterium]|nr:G5 domain-containing protein [Candidatus Saccharibacteria bacterium]